MSGRDPAVESWPAIPYSEWQSTCSALHRYLQIVGKYRLARSPWVNHSWHAIFYVTPRGLTTSLVPDVTGGIEVTFDFVDNVVRGECHSGRKLHFPLRPMTVAEFHEQFVDMIDDQRIDGVLIIVQSLNEPLKLECIQASLKGDLS